MASAYATIAAEGRRANPYLISKVTAKAIGVDYAVTPNVQDAFGKDVAADVIDAMEQVTKSGGTGARAAQVGRPVAGKTGTSEERKSVWFSGYTPQLAASVAMYKDVGGVMQPLTGIGGLDELSGNSFPLSIWIDFMRAALKGQDEKDFPARVGIGDDSVRSTATATRTATPAPDHPIDPGPGTRPGPDAAVASRPQEPTKPNGSATKIERAPDAEPQRTQPTGGRAVRHTVTQ